MRWILILCFALGLSGCGVDGEPSTPVVTADLQ